MDIIKNIKLRNNGVVTAAIYISCNKACDNERGVAEQLNLIHTFIQAKELIIVESYIDRDSTGDFNRLVSDLENNFFDLILICGENTAVEGLTNAVVIDVLI